MTNHFLGIDAGATKTHALIVDETGNIRAFRAAGPGNPQVIGYEQLAPFLDSQITAICEQADINRDRICAATFGMAGYDWPSQQPRFLKVMEKIGFRDKATLVNDAYLGIAAGTSQGWGICVTAGTSFNCRGRTPGGRLGRAIGEGMQWGEGAGALELSIWAAQAVMAQWTMQGPVTRLTDMFMEIFEQDNLDLLVEGMALEKYPITSSLAPRIFQVARAGDEVAIKLVHKAAQQLARLVVGVARQIDVLDQPFEVVMMGSLFKAGNLLIQPFSEAIYQQASQAIIKPLEVLPAAGGVLLAMDVAGLADKQIENVRNRLIDQAETVFDE